MEILFAPHGTRGDIQPLLALARALAGRGHRVRFVAPANAVEWIRAAGCPCESNGVDVETEVRAIESRPASMLRYVRRVRNDLAPRLFESVVRAAAGADVIVSSGIPISAPSVAEARGIPHVYALFCPGALPNDDGPPPVVHRLTLPRWTNRLLWKVLHPAGDLALRLIVSRGRARIGLATGGGSTGVRRSRVLVAADSELAPQAGAIPPNGLRTDAWVLDDGRQLDERVASFVRAGAAPVCVGFGSMIAPRSADLGRRAVSAARSAGCRLIVVGGWAALDRDLSESDDVLIVREAPHAALFPLMAAVVHHGGAGTTTAAARAGVPQVIVPHMLDQFYWAHRVESLGLGPRALRLGDATADALAQRISEAAGNPVFRDRSRALGARASVRDGVPEAVRYLERLT